MAVRRMPRSKIRGSFLSTFIVGPLLVAITARLGDRYFGQVEVEGLDELVQKRRRQNLDGDASCAINDALPADARRASLMQVSSKQIKLLSVNASLPTKANASVGLSGVQQPGGNPTEGLDATHSLAMTVESLMCNTPIFSPDGACPSACPYYTQEGGNDRACYFQCVNATGPKGCGSVNPDEDIPDDELMICRKCKVLGCGTCAKGKGDTCAKCESGYDLNSDGTCFGKSWYIWGALFTIVGVAGGFLVIWFVRLQFLPVTNADGLQEALAYRSSVKLRVGKNQLGLVGVDPDSDVLPLWPISTNMHAISVAGPGTMLHMNFQVAIIVYASGLIVTWVMFTYMTSPDLLTLGLHPTDTPQQLCSVTLSGKEMQQRLLPIKLLYIAFMFVGTFVFNIAFALYQRQRFIQSDDATTMTDFAVMLEGLPTMKGTDRPEEELKKCIQDATGEKVVGVSVCWDYLAKEEEVADAIEREVGLLEETPELPEQDVLDKQKAALPLNKIFGWVDGAIFYFTGEKAEPVVENPESDKAVEDMLKELETTGCAFVVFESEASRDKVLASGIKLALRGNDMTLTKTECDPDTINWTNFKVTDAEFFKNIAVGIIVMTVFLLVWCYGFYLPFANFQAAFSAQGDDPPFAAGFLFSMLVVIGNQIAYFISGYLAENVGYRYNDATEALHILFYTLACFINLLVDMAMEFYLAYNLAVANKVHTADGTLLEDMTSFENIFESYVMQRAVGGRLFAYCFPATFLIPFIVEPIFAIFLPYHICKLLLRTHPECKGRDAEKALEIFGPMDMTRYGDLLLNMLLSVLIILFPPGSFLKMMLCLVVCHSAVYCYDQYRMLRCVPSFDYSNDYIDRAVQLMMSIPSAVIAAVLVFKGGCLRDNPLGLCVKGNALLACMAIAFVSTMFWHIVIVKYIVPMFDNRWVHHEQSTESYLDLASSTASTWFSENAIHCLRSKYVHKHDPPCTFHTKGKEHLIRTNHDSGSHYVHAVKATSLEDY